MDGPNIDHSDSDSGESWTLLEDNPSYADEAPEFSDDRPRHNGNIVDNIDKDEDTDGISVITDSDPESNPCEIVYEVPVLEETGRPTEMLTPQYISVNPFSNNITDNHNESIRSEDDLLGENTGKLKTYVHRRNKRLSTVLNIIVLGSVITAAGVAIGHMWGVRDDCSMQTTPSVNKILSNLYKLQEENAYLRNKLKELTALSNIQIQQYKATAKKTLVNQPRCKKMFEEPLSNRNVNTITKCVDNDNVKFLCRKMLRHNAVQPAFETDFLSDIDKLKHAYMHNRSWLDEAIARRLKNEKLEQKHLKKQQKQNKLSNKPVNLITKDPAVIDMFPKILESDYVQSDEKNVAPKKKITYADSLKSEKDYIKTKQTSKSDNRETHRIKTEFRSRLKRAADTPLEDSFSEDEFRKDDRYIAPRHKQERKKHDRQHLHKKQKKKNKYEQWEMKSGYLRDYDDFSVTSSQENNFVLKNPDKNVLSRDFERNAYINQFSDADNNMKSTQTVESAVHRGKSAKGEKGKDKRNDKDLSWYEKRGALRTEARLKLEHELFGDSTPNNAGWYFKRMQKREQCRTKGDNSTYRKLSKRSMNFKLKH